MNAEELEAMKRRIMAEEQAKMEQRRKEIEEEVRKKIEAEVKRDMLAKQEQIKAEAKRKVEMEMASRRIQQPQQLLGTQEFSSEATNVQPFQGNFTNQEEMSQQRHQREEQEAVQKKEQEDEALRKQQEEMLRQQEEQKRQQEEAMRKQEEMIRRQQEMLRKQQEELRKQQEKQRRQQEEMLKRQQEEQQRKQREEMLRQQEEQRKQQEMLRRQQEEQQRRQQEEMIRRQQDTANKQQYDIPEEVVNDLSSSVPLRGVTECQEMAPRTLQEAITVLKEEQSKKMNLEQTLVQMCANFDSLKASLEEEKRQTESLITAIEYAKQDLKALHKDDNEALETEQIDQSLLDQTAQELEDDDVFGDNIESIKSPQKQQTKTEIEEETIDEQPEETEQMNQQEEGQAAEELGGNEQQHTEPSISSEEAEMSFSELPVSRAARLTSYSKCRPRSVRYHKPTTAHMENPNPDIITVTKTVEINDDSSGSTPRSGGFALPQMGMGMRMGMGRGMGIKFDPTKVVLRKTGNSPGPVQQGNGSILQRSPSGGVKGFALPGAPSAGRGFAVQTGRQTTPRGVQQADAGSTSIPQVTQGAPSPQVAELLGNGSKTGSFGTRSLGAFAQQPTRQQSPFGSALAHNTTPSSSPSLLQQQSPGGAQNKEVGSRPTLRQMPFPIQAQMSKRMSQRMPSPVVQGLPKQSSQRISSPVDARQTGAPQPAAHSQGAMPSEPPAVLCDGIQGAVARISQLFAGKTPQEQQMVGDDTVNRGAGNAVRGPLCTALMKAMISGLDPSSAHLWDLIVGAIAGLDQTKAITKAFSGFAQQANTVGDDKNKRFRTFICLCINRKCLHMAFYMIAIQLRKAQYSEDAFIKDPDCVSRATTILKEVSSFPLTMSIDFEDRPRA